MAPRPPATTSPRALRDRRGVSLARVVIVVALLAAVAVVSIWLNAGRERTARLAADQTTVSALRVAVVAYREKRGSFPADLAEVHGLVVPAPAYQCRVRPTYDPATGALGYSATADDCR